MMFLILESFRSALHSIRANALRSVLTSLGIIIGVASIITVVSLVQGLQASIDDQFESLGSNALIIQPDFNQEEYSGRAIYLSEDDLLAIRKRVVGLDSITPQVFLSNPRGLTYRGNRSSVDVRGVEPDLFVLDDTFADRGRELIAADLIGRSRVMVIGDKVRRDLQLPADPIGEYVQFGLDWFRVVGLLEIKGNFLGQDLDNVAYIPFTTATSITPIHSHPFMVFLAKGHPEDLDWLRHQINQVLRKEHKLQPGKPNDFKIESSEQIQQSIAQVTGIITVVFGGIVGISLLVGGIGIMNIMLVSVTERTREIGICKALGATRADIMLQFLIEAVVLCLLGGLIGLAAGFGLGKVIADLIPNFTPAVVPLWAVFLALGFSTGVGVLFGLLPAAKAARLDPIEALRYE